MEDEDLYAVLGVDRTADADAIRTAYRRLAREHHPDVNPDDPAAEERFKRVSAAHHVLSDPDKRKLYDEFGRAGLADGFDPEQARAYRRWAEGARRSPYHETFRAQGAGDEDVDIEELLSSFFGGAPGGAPGGGSAQWRAARGPRRGRDARGDVEVGFLDAVRGGEVSIELEGHGRLRVRIPPGADDGTRIRLAGKGEPGRDGGPPGDLVLALHVRPHALYERDGDDLSYDLPVTLPELVLGAEVDVPTPDGAVSMTVPPGSPNGRRLRLRGKGATRRGAKSGEGARGDLIVRLVAVLPEESDALRRVAEEMRSLYEGADVRAAVAEAARR
ncbi:MAG: DnaJ C-terminal domain-containing protein [Myxococcota bacterium]